MITDVQNMKIEKENKDNFDISTARILARGLDQISMVCNKKGCGEDITTGDVHD